MDRSSGRLLLDYRASEPVLVESVRSSLSDAPLSRSQIQRPSKPTAAPWNPGHVSPQPRPTMRRKLKLPGRSRSKHVTKLPRMDEVIPRVEITDAQQAAMREQAEGLIAGCLLKSKAAWNGTKQIFDDPKQWKLHSAKPHLAVYKRKDPHRRSATAHQFVASGRIPGLTLQDVEYGKYSDTTLDERSISAYLFRDYFLDAAVLQVLETQTEDDPFRFFGIKWIAFASPSGPARFFSPRDHAYYEYAKTVTTEDGNKVLVKVMQSVGDDILPPLTQIVGQDKPSDGVDPSKLRFVRGHISIITTYAFDSKVNAVKVFSEGSLDPGGRASAWLGSAFLSQFAPHVVRIEYCADIKYIMKHGMIFPHPPAALTHSQSGQSLGQSQSTMSGSEVTAHGPAALPLSASQTGFPPTFEMGRMSINPQPSWVPDHQRKVCFVCFKSFGIVRRHRHHCRMCGEVMCSRCMITLPLVAPPSSAYPDADDDDEGDNNEGDAIRPRRSHRHGQQPEGRPLSVLLKQPAKKSLEETRPNGYPAVNNVKLCKKCMFNIRQERKGTMRGATNFYAAPTMIKQFPLVLQGSLADNIGLQPGPMRGFFPGGRYAADDELINNAQRGGEEDDIEETDEEYSARVERMRQMHMAREKKKNLRRSILLYDEDDLNNGGESPPARPSHLFNGGNTSFNFDDLLLPTPKRDEDGEDANRLSNRVRTQNESLS
ncbi:1-phosphatidylinositol 3-phosphate 5-kinase [Phytophthora cinnamomi]|uniref:1-phosphatidylinositol 3-phosphate 5-kinase n=1 Tax=Phytophthora cinnamomi TaxID=4785 RepID=UPI003559CF96|nr:1-phosphatidylinositol 3-phosphate 5-kinase [Phytophthora cinnamomi]